MHTFTVGNDSDKQKIEENEGYSSYLAGLLLDF